MDGEVILRLLCAGQETQKPKGQVRRSSFYFVQAQVANDLGTKLCGRRTGKWIVSPKLLDIFLMRNPPLEKALLLISTIFPVLFYGYKANSTILAEKRMLAVTQSAMGRRTVGISKLHHVSNEDLRFRSGARDIVQVIYTRKYRWCGHMASLEDRGWTKQPFELCP